MPISAPPAELRFEHHRPDRPVLGIGTVTPRLSWIVPAADAEWKQTAYEVEVERASRTTTFIVQSVEQVLVPWPDAPLASREAARVRVRVACKAEWSDWSPPSVVEVGLLEGADWVGRFVSPVGIAGLEAPAPVLEGVWDLPDAIASARLYVTARGVFEVALNGARVGDDVLAPGWTSYHHRLRYRTHDVTDLVRAGRNDASALLGNGWYRGRLTWSGARALYGERLALLAQLEVVTTDGVRHVFTADDTWVARESGIRTDDLYDGQTTDLRPTSAPAHPVELVETDPSLLVAPDGPPIRVTEVVPAREVLRSPSGAQLVDFGQNVVGWVRLTARGLPSGHEVVVRHAEVLEDGELGVRPLRTALCTDSYTLAGTGEERLEPRFTFHGFRYAQVDGVDDLDPSDVEAVVIGSDLARSGWFDSSHPLLNRFHENVVWGMRGNFVDVPTDCPQRDERLGWTGDLQIFAPTAQFLFDSSGFLCSWLKDVAADQFPDGGVPFVVPDVLRNQMAAAAWGDAATVVPWVLYQRSRDVGVLGQQLESMRGWVDHMDAQAGKDGVWAGGFQFGDWLDPTAPPAEPFRAKADPDVIATAHLVHSAEILARAAALVGDEDLAVHAATIAERSRDGFVREFVTPGGRVLSDAQTAYALALCWDLLPTAEQRQRAAARLADLVRTSGFRISTGFVGTPLVTDALADHGHSDTAYRLLLQTGCPSWLYSVAMGATTVWERWDSMLPDGHINPGEMTSFNHYALGAVADWLHRSVAGLAPAAPGYRRIAIAPKPGGGLTNASARHRTPYGEAVVAWEASDGELVVRATVPVGASAEVALPGGEAFTVGHGVFEWRCPLEGARSGPPRTVRELMDDEDVWSRTVQAVIDAGVGGMVHVTDEASVADRMSAHLDQPISVIPDALTLGGSDAGRRRLVELLDEVVRATPARA